MPRKAPKGRDIREKEQKIRAQMREFSRRQFRNQTDTCPQCGRHGLMLKKHNGEVFFHCRICLATDCLPLNKGMDDIDLHSKFTDRFNEAAKVCYTHCLVLKILPGARNTATRFVEKEHVQDMMPRAPRIDEKNSIIWLFGEKKRLEDIRKALEQSIDRVLRDFPLRRDFWHFFNGEVHHKSRLEFRKMLAKEAYRLWSGKSIDNGDPVFARLFEKGRDPFLFLFDLWSGDDKRWLARAWKLHQSTLSDE